MIHDPSRRTRNRRKQVAAVLLPLLVVASGFVVFIPASIGTASGASGNSEVRSSSVALKNDANDSGIYSGIQYASRDGGFTFECEDVSMSAVTTRGNDLVVNAGEKLTITTEYGQRYKGGIIKVLEKDGWVADNEEIRKEETTSSIGSLSGWKEFPQEKEFSISRKEQKTRIR